MARRNTRAEPCTINGNVCAETLERLGYPQMAAFVRHLDSAASDANRRVDAVRFLHDQTLKRLHAYEPPKPHVVPNYQPPPEASD